MNRAKAYWPRGLVASVILHLTLIIGLSFWWPSLPQSDWQFRFQRMGAKPLEVKTLTQNEFRRLRQVGKKEGHREGFSAPVPQGEGNRFPERDEPVSYEPVTGQPNQLLDGLRALAPDPAQMKKIEPVPKAQEAPQDILGEQGQTEARAQEGRTRFSLEARELGEQSQAQRIARQQEQIQHNILRELGASPQAAEAIKRTGFNVQFETPEGIEEDELNSVEKIFYSFQRRTFYSYVTNFISSYQRMVFQKPHTKELLERESHHMIGRVMFDSEGHVTSLRILKPSQHRDITLMFEETLKNLNLPNPPRDLLNSEGRLIMNFHLRIN